MIQEAKEWKGEHRCKEKRIKKGVSNKEGHEHIPDVDPVVEGHCQAQDKQKQPGLPIGDAHEACQEACEECGELTGPQYHGWLDVVLLPFLFPSLLIVCLSLPSV